MLEIFKNGVLTTHHFLTLCVHVVNSLRLFGSRKTSNKTFWYTSNINNVNRDYLKLYEKILDVRVQFFLHKDKRFNLRSFQH